MDFGRPDEQRDHHVREDDHVPRKRQNREFDLFFGENFGCSA